MDKFNTVSHFHTALSRASPCQVVATNVA